MLTEHLLEQCTPSARRRRSGKGNTAGAVGAAGPVYQPGHALSAWPHHPSSLVTSFASDPPQSSVFFGGARDPGQPSPVFEPCPARCGMENTRVFVSKILLKITPSLESWSWTPPPSTSFASLSPLCTAVAPIGT